MGNFYTKEDVLKFSINIENVLLKIISNLNISELNSSLNSNSDINKILQNKKDELLFNDTVEYLKKHKNEKSKEISFSNNNSLTISIE